MRKILPIYFFLCTSFFTASAQSQTHTEEFDSLYQAVDKETLPFYNLYDRVYPNLYYTSLLLLKSMTKVIYSKQ